LETRAVRGRASYGCSATQDGGRKEYLRARGRAAITVLSARGVDADVHVLDERARRLPRAGDHRCAVSRRTYVAADTFVGTRREPGEYLLLAVRSSASGR
jgi:hypothetical protein